MTAAGGAGRKRRRVGRSVPEREILERIARMGYTACKLKRARPSYYAIKDGSGAVVRVRIEVITIVPNPDGSGGILTCCAIQVATFVPKERRRPSGVQKRERGGPRAGKADAVVDFEPIRERYSEYEFGGGQALRVKVVAVRITKSGSFSEGGEPVYDVETKDIIKIGYRGKCNVCGRDLTAGHNDHG